MQHVVMGALFILNKNIDLKVGVANGTTRLVTKFEFDFKNNICNILVAINQLRYVLQIFEKKHTKKIKISKDICTRHHSSLYYIIQSGCTHL
jgi:hypothetical protein